MRPLPLLEAERNYGAKRRVLEAERYGIPRGRLYMVSQGKSPKPKHRLLMSLLCCFLVQPTIKADEAQPPVIRLAVPELGERVAVTALANRIYREAFHRLGYDYESHAYPGERGIFLVQQRHLDGLAHRARMFQAAYPSLVRVEQPIGSVHIVAYTARTDYRLASWDALRDQTLEVDWWRDIRYIGGKLRPVVAPNRLEPLATNNSGFCKLLAGRSDLFVTIKEVAETYLDKPTLDGTGIHIAGELDRMELYPYLGSQHRDLAPRLAEVLRQMEAEGLLDHTPSPSEMPLP